LNLQAANGVILSGSGTPALAGRSSSLECRFDTSARDWLIGFRDAGKTFEPLFITEIGGGKVVVPDITNAGSSTQSTF